MAIVTDITDLAELTRFIREDVPANQNWILNRFLPDDYIQDIQVDVGTVNRTARVAQYRAYDAETPIGKRDTLTTSKVTIPPVGQKLVLGEYERLQLERARGAANSSVLEDEVYNDAANNARAIQARAELARGDVLTDGKFTLTDENGLTVEYDSGVDNTHVVSAGTAWSTTASADPVADLRTWRQVFIDDAGEPPAYALTSSRVMAYLLQNAAIRALVASASGTPGIVTPAQLNTALTAFGLPMLVEYDARVDVAGTSTRTIPDDKVILLPADGRSLGRTVWGITAEALELANSGAFDVTDMAGMTAVTMKDGDPVRVWTKAAATCMPVIDDPRKILIADVAS